MANEIWIRKQDSPPTTSQGVGTWSNDGWTVMATYPRSSLPQSATQRLAIYVTGRVGHVDYVTSWPLQFPGGQMEVCLGLASGLKSVKHRLKVPLYRNTLPGNPPGFGLDDRGQSFTFMLVQQASPSISDNDFGAVFDTTSMSDLVIWARTYRNGDPAYYSLSFDVFDVQWLVMDMDALEADSRVRAHEYDWGSLGTSWPATAALSSATADPSPAGDIGSPGQKWLTFAQASYNSGAVNDFTLSFGYELPFDTKLVLGDSTGTNPLGLTDPRSQQGGFFTHTIGSGQQWIRAYGQNVLSTPFLVTSVYRIAWLSIRVDDLLYFSQANLPTTTVGALEGVLVGVGSASNTATYNGQTPGYHEVPMESVPATGTFHPIILAQAHLILPTTGPQAETTTKLQLRNGTGGIINEHEGWQWQREGVVGIPPHRGIERSMNQLFTQTTAQASLVYSFSMDVRYRDWALYVDIVWPCMLMFHDTLNATNNLPTPKWANLTPVPITITAEGPLVGSMNALPFAPDASIQQTMEPVRFGEVKGSQGYRRTWPTWVKPRRGWSLSWNPLSKANAATLRAFLDVNDSFAFTPPGYSTALPVMITSEVGSSVMSDGREAIRCNVTELLFTA